MISSCSTMNIIIIQAFDILGLNVSSYRKFGISVGTCKMFCMR